MRKEYDFSKAKRGAAVPLPKGKIEITIRLDDDILKWFKERVEKAGGGNYRIAHQRRVTRAYSAGGRAP